LQLNSKQCSSFRPYCYVWSIYSPVHVYLTWTSFLREIVDVSMTWFFVKKPYSQEPLLGLSGADGKPNCISRLVFWRHNSITSFTHYIAFSNLKLMWSSCRGLMRHWLRLLSTQPIYSFNWSSLGTKYEFNFVSFASMGFFLFKLPMLFSKNRKNILHHVLSCVVFMLKFFCCESNFALTMQSYYWLLEGVENLAHCWLYALFSEYGGETSRTWTGTRQQNPVWNSNQV